MTTTPFFSTSIKKLVAKEGFDLLALRVFSYQFKRNKNYRRYCLQEGKNPENVSHWKEIPAIPTSGFKEFYLATFPRSKAVRVFETSGTAADKKGQHYFSTLKFYRQALVPTFKRALLPDQVKNLQYFFMINSPETAPTSSLSYMMGVVNEVFAKGKGMFYARKDCVDYQGLLKDLRRTKKRVFILSTAFALKGFLDFLKSSRQRVSLSKGSRLMETGGFKGKIREVTREALIGDCGKYLGLAKDYCIGEYGMTELSSQFYDTTLCDKIDGLRRKSFKMGPPWTRTLVIDPRTGHEAKKGESGLLRHFDLANLGSVMAIQTDDLGKRVGEGFEFIGRIQGSVLRGCSLSYEHLVR